MRVRRFGLVASIALTAPTAGHVSARQSQQPRAGNSSETIFKAASDRQVHASTIVEARDGTLVAAWFGGTAESAPDVKIWLSRRVHNRWQEPTVVGTGIQDDGTSLPSWNPVLFKDGGGRLWLFYKVGPEPRNWWGIVRVSTDNGRSWSVPKRMPAGILGPTKNKPLIFGKTWLAPSSRERADGWTIHFERSEDQGTSWLPTADVASPLHLDAIQPALLWHPGGSIEALARTRQGVIAMTWSRDAGRTWTPLAATDLPNPNSGIDALTLADGRYLVIYNHSAHDPDRPGYGPRYPLEVAISRDGIHWIPSLALESKPSPEGYAYPSVIQASDGRIHICYTWNRTAIRHVVFDPKSLGAASGIRTP